MGERYSLVLAGEGWHPGVLGIVASRIVEKFYRPTVVIGFNDGEARARRAASAAFTWSKDLRRCADSLEKFGGHEYAGGLSIKPEKLEPFAAAFESGARKLFRRSN